MCEGLCVKVEVCVFVRFHFGFWVFVGCTSDWFQTCLDSNKMNTQLKIIQTHIIRRKSQSNWFIHLVCKLWWQSWCVAYSFEIQIGTSVRFSERYWFNIYMLVESFEIIICSSVLCRSAPSLSNLNTILEMQRARSVRQSHSVPHKRVCCCCGWARWRERKSEHENENPNSIYRPSVVWYRYSITRSRTSKNFTMDDNL